MRLSARTYAFCVAIVAVVTLIPPFIGHGFSVIFAVAVLALLSSLLISPAWLVMAVVRRRWRDAVYLVFACLLTCIALVMSMETNPRGWDALMSV